MSAVGKNVFRAHGTVYCARPKRPAAETLHSLFTGASISALASNTFTDIDAGDVLTYSATLADDSALPGWLDFDPVTRTFSGVPGAVNFGQITIKVTVTDQASATASLTFVLQVKGKLFLPVVLRSS